MQPIYNPYLTLSYHKDMALSRGYRISLLINATVGHDQETNAEPARWLARFAYLARIKGGLILAAESTPDRMTLSITGLARLCYNPCVKVQPLLMVDLPR